MREWGEKCKTWVSVDLKILNYWITSQHPNTVQCPSARPDSGAMYQETKSERVKRNCCWDEFVSSVTEVASTTLHHTASLSTAILETLSRNENIWQERCEGGGDSCQAGQHWPVQSTALLFNFPVYKCLEIVNVARKLNSVMQSVMTNYYMFSKVQKSRISWRGELHTHSLVWVKSWHKMNKC